jgi:hypothetical protein
LFIDPLRNVSVIQCRFVDELDRAPLYHIDQSRNQQAQQTSLRQNDQFHGGSPRMSGIALATSMREQGIGDLAQRPTRFADTPELR